MDVGERAEVLEKWKLEHLEKHAELEAKVERLLSELAEILKMSGRVKNIKISDSGKGKDK
jgi:predicted nucleic acid-binding Zn ribbon protein